LFWRVLFLTNITKENETKPIFKICLLIDLKSAFKESY